MDEDTAAKEWEKYYWAIKKYGLDSIQDRNHQEGTINYMYDAFFTGFYSGRDCAKRKQRGINEQAVHEERAWAI